MGGLRLRGIHLDLVNIKGFIGKPHVLGVCGSSRICAVISVVAFGMCDDCMMTERGVGRSLDESGS